MKQVATMFLCGSLAAQTVSFSPQGASVLRDTSGRLIRGVQIVDIVTCPSGSETISNGRIWQRAISVGFAPISPSAGSPLLSRSASGSFITLGTDTVSTGTQALVLAGVSKALSLSQPWLLALTAGHWFLDAMIPRLRQQAPNPTPIISKLLDPEGRTAFAGASCAEATMLARYDKTHAAPIGPIALDAPVPLAFDIPMDPVIVNYRVARIMAVHAAGVE